MVDCRRVVGPGQDPDYVRLLAANRISFDDTVALGLLHPERPLPPSASNEGGHRLLLEKAEELAQCEAIRRAYHFAAKARSPTEADFPLAYARVIFRVSKSIGTIFEKVKLNIN